jgi:hypothetical protein
MFVLSLVIKAQKCLTSRQNESGSRAQAAEGNVTDPDRSHRRRFSKVLPSYYGFATSESHSDNAMRAIAVPACVM